MIDTPISIRNKPSIELRACFWSPFRSSTIANRRLNLVRACTEFDRRWSMVDDLIGDQKQALAGITDVKKQN